MGDLGEKAVRVPIVSFVSLLPSALRARLACSAKLALFHRATRDIRSAPVAPPQHPEPHAFRHVIGLRNDLIRIASGSRGPNQLTATR